MEWPEILTCLLIVGGRIVDVSLGTIRTIFVVRGRRRWACVLGFFEVLVWVLVISSVLTGLKDNPLYVLSYGLGFALGNYFGITIEKRLAVGTQVLQVFSRKGRELGQALRQSGYRLTQFAGEGRDGPTTLLMIVVERQKIDDLVSQVRTFDRECFYTVEDIRQVGATGKRRDNWWWDLFKAKK